MSESPLYLTVIYCGAVYQYLLHSYDIFFYF